MPFGLLILLLFQVAWGTRCSDLHSTKFSVSIKKLTILSLALMRIYCSGILGRRRGFVQDKTYLTKYFWKMYYAEEKSLNSTWRALSCFAGSISGKVNSTGTLPGCHNVQQSSICLLAVQQVSEQAHELSLETWLCIRIASWLFQNDFFN